MLNHTLIKRSLATAAIVAAAGLPASAQAMFVSADGGGSVPSTLPAVKATAPSVSRTGSGFQWDDAGVGAAGATVLLGAGALGAGMTRRRRRIAVR
jgi:hypothetical protein